MSVTVRDIITQWLQSHGCDGLCGGDAEDPCVCDLDSLQFCAEMLQCEPGKRLAPDDVLIPATLTLPDWACVGCGRHYSMAVSECPHCRGCVTVTTAGEVPGVVPGEVHCEKCVHRDRRFCILPIGNHCIHRAEDYFEARK